MSEEIYVYRDVEHPPYSVAIIHEGKIKQIDRKKLNVMGGSGQ